MGNGNKGEIKRESEEDRKIRTEQENNGMRVKEKPNEVYERGEE